jgi:hypothetical protein
MADDPKLFDKRVVQRYLKKGLLDEKEYRKHLDALPDLAERADEIESTFEPGTPPPRPPPPMPAPSGANGVPVVEFPEE